MKLKGAKAGSSCGGLRSVETNSELDIHVCYCFAASWHNNDDDDDWHCISSVHSQCTIALTFFSFRITRTSVNTDVCGWSPEVRVNEVLL